MLKRRVPLVAPPCQAFYWWYSCTFVRKMLMNAWIQLKNNASRGDNIISWIFVNNFLKVSSFILKVLGIGTHKSNFKKRCHLHTPLCSDTFFVHGLVQSWSIFAMDWTSGTLSKSFKKKFVHGAFFWVFVEFNLQHSRMHPCDSK